MTVLFECSKGMNHGDKFCPEAGIIVGIVRDESEGGFFPCGCIDIGEPEDGVLSTRTVFPSQLDEEMAALQERQRKRYTPAPMSLRLLAADETRPNL